MPPSFGGSGGCGGGGAYCSSFSSVLSWSRSKTCEPLSCVCVPSGDCCHTGSNEPDVPQTMLSPSSVPHTMLSPSSVPHTMLSPSSAPPTVLSSSVVAPMPLPPS